MLKQLLLLGIICVCIAIGGGVFLYVSSQPRKPNFDALGGTALVFDIDPRDAASVDRNELCSALQKRFDPIGNVGVEVEPEGDSRIVVRVPMTVMHNGTVAAVKTTAARRGLLEMLMVANDADDKQAIDVAKKALAATPKEELARLQKEGLPPASPSEKGKTTFAVNLPDEPEHSYRWTELSRWAASFLRLDEPPPDGEEKNLAQRQFDEGLASGQPYLAKGAGGFASLLYVRATAEGRKSSAGPNEVFVLLREEDANRCVTGHFITKAEATPDQRGRPTVSFTLNKEGANRLYEMTARNKPTTAEENEKRRHLAVVLDDQIAAAPVLLSPIRDRAWITGELTMTEVSDIARMLNSSVLPCRLIPKIADERSIEPRK